LFNPLVANIGIHYDLFDYNQDQQWRHRVGLAYTISDKTTLRAAWGYYYQSPIYIELTNTKGADVINPKAEKAIHYVFGIERQFGNNFNIRFEGYIKILTQMIGHYFKFQESSKYPIIKYGNPFNGHAKGIELFINGDIIPNLL